MGAAILLAALSGLIGVAAGAFGAHAAGDAQTKAWLETASRHQLIHALAVFAALWLAQQGPVQAAAAAWCFLAGALVFCGALYALVLGAPRAMGAVAPLGGVLFMIGWAILAWAGADLLLKRGGTP